MEGTEGEGGDGGDRGGLIQQSWSRFKVSDHHKVINLNWQVATSFPCITNYQWSLKLTGLCCEVLHTSECLS